MPKMKYNAFISYSHSADNNIASLIKISLQRFAKPWNRLRSTRVFLDKTNLSVNPALWPSIEDSLNNCILHDVFLYECHTDLEQTLYFTDSILIHQKQDDMILGFNHDIVMRNNHILASDNRSNGGAWR